MKLKPRTHGSSRTCQWNRGLTLGIIFLEWFSLLLFVYRRICISRRLADRTIAFPITDQAPPCQRSQTDSFFRKTVATSALAHFDCLISGSVLQSGGCEPERVEEF